ncbi:hypothetical protein D3C72_2209510 [compost metagenome]
MARSLVSISAILASRSASPSAFLPFLRSALASCMVSSSAAEKVEALGARFAGLSVLMVSPHNGCHMVLATSSRPRLEPGPQRAADMSS